MYGVLVRVRCVFEEVVCVDQYVRRTEVVLKVMFVVKCLFNDLYCWIVS